MENRLHSLIVEDVPDTSEYIKQRIKKLCPVIKTIDQAFTLGEAKKMIRINQYHIVFLDIQMPSGTSFDLLQQISEEGSIEFEIIFITGEGAKEYVIRAIKYSAIDFLYKPLDDSELVLAVNKAIDKLNKQTYNKQISLLLERMIPDQPKSNKMAFHIHGGIIEMIDITDIKFMKADGVVSYVFMKNGQKIATTKNLGFYKDMLVHDYNFVLISNSTLVNRDIIKRYNHRELSVVLTDGVVLWASKRFGKELKDILREGNRGKQFFHDIISGISFFNKSS
jgi:two-component system, LytTR family, response regulator